MRVLQVTALAALVMTACSIRVGSDAGSPSPRAAAPARPAPAPAPPPPAPAAPPPAAAPAPAPAPAPAAPPAAMGRRMGGLRPTPAPGPAPASTAAHQVSPSIAGGTKLLALNLVRIREHQAKSPKGCGFTEVAPDQWIKIDCHAYQPSAKAIAHMSPRKLRMFAQKKATAKPLRLVRRSMRVAPGASTTPGGGAAGGERANGERAGGEGDDIQPDALPGTVDHRTDKLEGPVKDQGSVGSCTAFSLSSTLDNAGIRAGKITVGSVEQSTSPNHVWSGYGIPQMGTAADASLGRSIATQALWPQNNKEACKLADAFYEQECGFDEKVVPGSWRSDTTIMNKYNQSNASPTIKINGIERLQTQPANADELLSALASGSSLWIAMKIDGLAWSNRSMKSAVIPDWTTPAGGHAVVMSGYRDTPGGRQYLIHNSWGTSWGDGGYAWVSEAMVNKWMHYAYKVKIDGGVKKEDLTDDDCSPEELLDITTGLCGLICPGDLRPNNGCATASGKK